MSFKRYTDEQRAAAVVLLDSLGYPETPGVLERAVKETKIPRTTLQGWWSREHNPPPEELVTKARGDLAEMLRSHVDANLEQMNVLRPAATFRDVAWATAVFIDKIQLITGQPTEHSRLSGDSENPIEIKAVNYRNAIASLAPRSMEDSDASGEG